MRFIRPLLFASGCTVLSGCLLFAGRNWETTRKEVIDPINSAIHRHLPRDVKNRDLEAILSLYATDAGSGLTWAGRREVVEDFGEQRARWSGPPGGETIRERYEALLALFDVVEKAEVRIHRIYWHDRDALGYPADVRMIVRGLGGGERRTLDQRARMWIQPRGSGWFVGGEEIVARELLSRREPGFVPVTEAAGVPAPHDTSGAPIFRLIGGTTISSGSAVADVDCDGLEDFALAGSQNVLLYRNLGNGTFDEIGAGAGFSGGFDIAATGLVFFDADNDGDPDLWVCGVRGNRFYRNDRCGEFVDVTATAGIATDPWSSMPTVADYDRDGLADVYVVRMGDHEDDIPQPNWDARNGLPGVLYRNRGDGTFTDVTAKAGVASYLWGMAGGWGDYDDDGYPDLYVGNEYGTNALFHNDGDGTFTDVTDRSGTRDRGAAMGVTWGDYDGDGRLDLYVSNMYANSRWALLHPDFPPPVPWYFSWVSRAQVDTISEELTRGNSLLRNNGDGTFTDVSDQAGIRDCQWGWAAEFFDYNNDGHVDLFHTNGYVSNPIPDDV